MRKLTRVTLESILWICARIILTILIVLAILLLVDYASTKNFDFKSLKASLIAKRLYYSEDCFALNNLKVKAGEIDKAKFNEVILKKCVKEVPVKVELVNNKLIISNDKSFDDKAELCFSKEKECMTSHGLNQMLNNFDKKMEDCYFNSRCLYETRQYVFFDGKEDIMKIFMVIE